MKKGIKNVVEKVRPKWAFLVFAAVAAFLVWEIAATQPANPAPATAAAPQTPVIRRPIDGVLVPEGTPPAFPLAVIIENMIDARPPSGVRRANLVWEAPTEAGITRFLALYADGTEVIAIGPVRSARLYFVDWAEEVRALLAHVGGSPEALAAIPSRAITDLNEFWAGEYFWRAYDRAAPHNVYTSTELFDEARTDYDLGETPTFGVWKFKEDEPFEARPDAQEFSVAFSTPAYAVTWKYHRTANEYVRWQLGDVYRDIDGAEIRAKNVVVMVTDIQIIDEVGRRRIKTIGEGEARIFRDGMVTPGIWKRPRLDSRTRFFDRDGSEIAMNAGTTWIEVVGDLEALSVPTAARSE